MKPLLNLLFAAIILPATVSAQTIFKPGYIVTLKGDTLRGEIDCREWDKNPQFINFKAPGNTVEKHDVNNTKGFGVTNAEVYERYVFTATTAYVSTNMLTQRDTTVRTDTAFLKVICRGPFVNLYEYTDAIKTRYYIKPAGQSTVSELLYRVYVTEENTRQPITENFYHNQLTLLAHQAHKADDKTLLAINRTDYYSYQIEPIINKLNNIIAGKQTTDRSAVRFFAGAGVNIEQLKYSGGINNGTAPKPNTSAYPLLHVGIDFLPNKMVQQYFLRLEASYTGGNMTTASLGRDYNYYAFTIQQRTFSLSPQFIYNLYNGDAFKAFLGTGVTFNFSSYPKNTTEIYNTATTSNTFNNYLDLKKWWVAVPVHAGITVKNHYEFNFCYAFAEPLTKYMLFKIKPVIYQAGVNYLF